MTPPQSAPPVSDLEDLASIPLAASIVNLTDEENGLTPTIELTWNLMLMIRLMWNSFLKFTNERNNDTSEGLNEDLNDNDRKKENIDTT